MKAKLFKAIKIFFESLYFLIITYTLSSMAISFNFDLFGFLCRVANIIKPNMTEACFLLGEKYKDGPYSREYIDDILIRLAVLTEKPSIVLTGAWLEDDLAHLGAATYDRSTGQIDYILGPTVEGSYHGTGDVFGSAIVGAVLTGHSVAESVRIAVDFTVRAIRLTHAAGTEIRYGVNFEACLGSYIKDLGLF